MKFNKKKIITKNLKQVGSQQKFVIKDKKKSNLEFLNWHYDKINNNVLSILDSKINSKHATKEQKTQLLKIKNKFKIKIFNKIQFIENSFNKKSNSDFTSTELKQIKFSKKIRGFNKNDVKTTTVIDQVYGHSMKDGKKQTCEKIFLKSVKLLQKQTNKQTSELIKLSIIFSTPTFKLHKIENKKQKNEYVKEIPKFINNSEARTSLAVKYITSICKQKKLPTFAECLCEEILLNSQKKGFAVQKKKDLQEKILKLQKYTKSYRWN